MYVKIENNKLMGWCKKPYSDYEFVDIDYDEFDFDKYKVIDGVLQDISNTQEYINAQAQKQKAILLVEYKQQLDDLDKKRIRAIAEPSVKNIETGETWLDYYNSQIVDIRDRMNNL